MNTIVVRFDKKYGNTLCYPVNETAKRFAAIAGTRTLTPDAVRQIRALGFKIEAQDTDHLKEILADPPDEPEPIMLRRQAD